ncbi:MAG: hypothetical protein AAGK37_04395 [Pseudomonadota bacterium]
MNAMFAAFAAIIVIAVAADQGLDRFGGFSSADRQSAPSVRLD